MSSELLYDVADGVARVTINRPERRNALSWGVISGIRTRIAEAKADDAVRVVVLTGAGDKAFCAGADLGGMAEGAGYLDLHDGRGELAGCSRTCGSSASPRSPGCAATPSPAASVWRSRATW